MWETTNCPPLTFTGKVEVLARWGGTPISHPHRSLKLRIWQKKKSMPNQVFTCFNFILTHILGSKNTKQMPCHVSMSILQRLSPREDVSTPERVWKWHQMGTHLTSSGDPSISRKYILVVVALAFVFDVGQFVKACLVCAQFHSRYHQVFSNPCPSHNDHCHTLLHITLLQITLLPKVSLEFWP